MNTYKYLAILRLDDNVTKVNYSFRDKSTLKHIETIYLSFNYGVKKHEYHHIMVWENLTHILVYLSIILIIRLNDIILKDTMLIGYISYDFSSS